MQLIRPKAAPKGAIALSGNQLRELLSKVRASDYCRVHDLIDPITVLIATGLRRSELLGLRWVDFDAGVGTLTVTGNVVRVAGPGLERIDEAKSASGKRTIPLPMFAVVALTQRRAKFARQARTGKGKVGKAARSTEAPKRKRRGKWADAGAG